MPPQELCASERVKKNKEKMLSIGFTQITRVLCNLMYSSFFLFTQTYTLDDNSSFRPLAKSHQRHYNRYQRDYLYTFKGIHDETPHLLRGVKFGGSRRVVRQSAATGGTNNNLFLTSKFAPQKCKKIRVERCAYIGYNMTKFPNLAGDASETTATESFLTFEPLIGVKCSPELPFFLCAVYFPMCTEKVSVAIGPCRSLCETIRSSCINVLKEFGFPWPASLNCSKFPAANTQDQMCMEGGPLSMAEKFVPDKGEEPGQDDYENEKISRVNARKELISSPPRQREEFWSQVDENFAEHLKKYVLPGQKCLFSSSMIYVNRSAQCVPLCKSARGYTTWDLAMARTVMLMASILSTVLISVCTVGALLLRRGRHRQQLRNNRRPYGMTLDDDNRLSLHRSKYEFEDSLFYSSNCFLICALLQLFGVYEMQNLACTQYNYRSVFVVAGATVDHTPCTLYGTLLYFFGSAARLWWLLLCRRVQTQHRCYSDKNNGTLTTTIPPTPTAAVTIQQREKARSATFNVQLAAWCSPLALCTLALMARAVYAEPMTGLCRVGGASEAQHRVFVLARDAIFATLAAIIFIIYGAINAQTNAGHDSPKKLSSTYRCYFTVFRLFLSLKGFISSLFSLITISLLLIQVYEYRNKYNDKPLQTYSQPSFNALVVNWNVTAVYRLFSDAILGILIGLAHFIYLANAYCNRNAETNYRNTYEYRSANIEHDKNYGNGSIFHNDNNSVNDLYYDRARTFSSSSAYQPLQLEMPTGLDMIGNSERTLSREKNNGALFRSGYYQQDGGAAHFVGNNARNSANSVGFSVKSAKSTNATGYLLGKVAENKTNASALPPPPAPPNTATPSGESSSCQSTGIMLPPLPPPPPNGILPTVPKSAIYTAK